MRSFRHALTFNNNVLITREVNILIAPDKFKGSLSGAEVAEAMAKGCLRAFPAANVVQRPLADGGEGSLSIFQEVLPLKVHRLEVCGPLRRPVQAVYLLGEEKAFIEVAQACGLQQVPAHRRDPGYTTTIGVGELIEDALARGAKDIYLFLGGSATNDCGAGMAGALGYRFFSDQGKDFIPAGNSLSYVRSIDDKEVNPLVHAASFTAVADVNNPLLGPRGATLVYAAQKGATPKALANLEQQMFHFNEILENFTSKPIASQPGAGAAGGLGAACLAFLGGTIKPGIEVVMEAVGFEELLSRADLVLTGEGKIDEQTAHGKVVSGVAAAADASNVPVLAFGGVRTVSKTALPALTGLYALLDDPKCTPQRAMADAAILLEDLVATVLADYKD